MPAPTPPTTLAAYRRLRELGTPRATAVRLVGISYNTGQRHDHDLPGRCPRCGHPEQRKGT